MKILKKLNWGLSLLLIADVFFIAFMTWTAAIEFPSGFWGSWAGGIWFVFPIAALVHINWFYCIPNYLITNYKWKYIAVLFLSIACVGLVIGYHPFIINHDTFFYAGSFVIRIPNLVMGSYVTGMIVLFSLPFYFSYSWFAQQKKIAELSNEQLTANISTLKSQISPHFFFNTLNNLHALIDEDQALAKEMLIQLSECMRYAIENGAKDQVMIQNEIEFIEQYLEIQKLRFNKNVEIIFDKHIYRNTSVPPLLFINIIENAFKHGTDTLTEDAYIHLKLEVQQTQLFFKVTNNYDPSSRKNGLQTGLSNLRQRLHILYPHRHSFIIQDLDATFNVELTILLP